MICDFREQETRVLSGSFFTTEQICPACTDREQAHPRFQEAVQAEHEACRNGEVNFPGVGLPPDLQVEAEGAGAQN